MNQKNTITTLHNLFFSENKPAKLKPIDIALVTYLVLRQTEDHFIHDSQLTLGSRLGCGPDAIADSVKRLDKLGWIVVEKPWHFNQKTKNKTRVIGKTVSLAVNWEKLPTPKDRAKHSKVSAEAVELAQQHTNILLRNDLHKKLLLRRPKNFKRLQEAAAQRLIDDLGAADAVDVLNFALREKRFQKAAQTSLYKVRERLPTIKAAFDAAKMAPKKTEQPAQIAS